MSILPSAQKAIGEGGRTLPRMLFTNKTYTFTSVHFLQKRKAPGRFADRQRFIETDGIRKVWIDRGTLLDGFCLKPSVKDLAPHM